MEIATRFRRIFLTTIPGRRKGGVVSPSRCSHRTPIASVLVVLGRKRETKSKNFCSVVLRPLVVNAVPMRHLIPKTWDLLANLVANLAACYIV